MATLTLAEIAGDAASVASLLVPEASPEINAVLLLMQAEPTIVSFFQSIFSSGPVTADQLPVLAKALVAQKAAEAAAAKIDGAA
jgi:hypothetical protein